MFFPESTRCTVNAVTKRAETGEGRAVHVDAEKVLKARACIAAKLLDQITSCLRKNSAPTKGMRACVFRV